MKKIYGKIIREKKNEKKVREENGKNNTGKKVRKKSKGKSHVTSGDVTSGHAQWFDPPQMLTELSPYTTDAPPV